MTHENYETPGRFQGSPVNAAFLDEIGLDPERITGDPLVFEILDSTHVLIRYTGVHVVTARDLEAAFAQIERANRVDPSD